MMTEAVTLLTCVASRVEQSPTLPIFDEDVASVLISEIVMSLNNNDDRTVKDDCRNAARKLS